MWWWTRGVKVNSIVCKQSAICSNKTLWCGSSYSLSIPPWIITLSCLSFKIFGPVDLSPAAVGQALHLQTLCSWHLVLLSCPKHLILWKSKTFWCAMSHLYRPNVLLPLQVQVRRKSFHVSKRAVLQIFRNVLYICIEQHHFSVWKGWWQGGL